MTSSNPTAEVHIRIDHESEQYVATTPHVPDLSARGGKTAEAVNRLVRQVREHSCRYECCGKAVPWIQVEPATPDKDLIVMRLTGLAPANTMDPGVNTQTPELPDRGGELNEQEH